MRRLYIVLIILVIAVIAAVSVGLALYYKTPPNTADLKANATVSIGKITSDFIKDSSKARKKYNNDVIVLNGTVDKTEKGQKGHLNIDFAANGVNVQCGMQDDAEKEAEGIKPGENIKLKGQFTGYTIDEIDPQPQLQFRDCIIVK